MSTNIDSLTIKVDAQVDGAIARLTQLNNVLVTLQQNSGLGKINQQLNKISAKGVTNSIDRARKAVENLNNTKVDKLSNSLNSLKSVSSGVMGVIKSGLTIAAGIQFSKPISAINDYVENLNLFKVAMGDNYEEAYEYANLLEDKMGIDSSEWMRNQGIIQSMANGFGIAEDKAYQFSKGMTEVAYDLSSFYNLPIDVAMQKIESGIAGEIEPLRRLGFALSEASLQEVALAHGLDTNIRAMSEAEKAQLRYIAIVEQAGAQGAIGDFAKTLSSPANALRILSQQVQQLARAVGSVFIPILTAVLPYIQAFVSVVTNAVRALASLVGFKLPDWSGSSWSGVEAGSAAVSDNMGTAAKNAKKMSDNIQGFDELHTLDDDTSSGGGGGGGISGGGIGDLTMPSVWDEATIAAIDSQVEAIKQKILELPKTIMGAFKELPTGVISTIAGIATAIPTFFAATKLFPNIFGGFGDSFKEEIIKAGIGLGDLEKQFTSIFSNVGQILLKPFQTLGGYISTLSNIVMTKLSPIFSKVGGMFSQYLITPIQNAFGTLTGKITSFLTPIQTTVTSVFGKMGTTVSGAFAKFTNLPVVSKAIGGLQSAFTAMGNGIASIMPNVNGIGTALQGLMNTITGSPILLAAAVAAIVATIVYLWNNNEEFRNNVIAAWDNIVAVAQNLWNNILKPLIDVMIPIIMDIYNNAIKPLWDRWTEFVAAIINIMLNLWNSIAPVLNDLIEWLGPIITNVVEALGPTFNAVFTTVSSVIQIAISVATAVFEGFANTIGSVVNAIVGTIQGIIDFVVGVFTGDWEKAWEGVKKIFSSMWDGLKGIVSGAWDAILGLFAKGGEIFSGVVGAIGEVFKKIVNSIIKGINWVIRQPFNFINGILNTIKEISILGMQPFYGFWGYNPLPVPQIPLLAQGGYVGANDPRLAVIGDNRKYGEIVAPENKIYDISYEAFKDAQGEDRTYEAVYNAVVQALQDNPINADVYIDGTKMTKKMAQINRKLERQVGKNVFVG